jgi:hypothetical protein
LVAADRAPLVLDRFVEAPRVPARRPVARFLLDLLLDDERRAALRLDDRPAAARRLVDRPALFRPVLARRRADRLFAFGLAMSSSPFGTLTV